MNGPHASEALDLLQHWQQSKVLIGVMFQPFSSGVHVSLVGYLQSEGASKLLLCVPQGRQYGFLEIDLRHVKEIRRTVLGQLKTLFTFVGDGLDGLTERPVIAFSLNPSGHLFLFDVSASSRPA